MVFSGGSMFGKLIEMVQKLSGGRRNPTKANGLCGERKRSGCGWMFPERGTEQSNTCADEARGKVHGQPNAPGMGVGGCPFCFVKKFVGTKSSVYMAKPNTGNGSM